MAHAVHRHSEGVAAQLKCLCGAFIVRFVRSFGEEFGQVLEHLDLAGIARLADFMVAKPIRDGKLVPLLADQHHPERTPAYAVFPPGTQKVPKVRVFLDFLVERFRPQPS